MPETVYVKVTRKDGTTVSRQAEATKSSKPSTTVKSTGKKPKGRTTAVTTPLGKDLTQTVNEEGKVTIRDSNTGKVEETYYVDEKNTVSVDSNWLQTGASWLYTVPFGAYKLFDYIHTKYSETLPIYITECGMAQSLDSLTDLDRIHYLSGYLYEIERLQHDTIKGFFVWSLLDNFEWARGFNESFGIIQVDYTNNFERTPKSSFYFLKNMIGMSQTNTINTNNN